MPDDFDLCGCFDGFVVTYDGEEVASWPTLTGAARGLTTAKEAKQMLVDALARQAA